MKKYVVFLFIILLTNNFSQTNISELEGMEDPQGKSHSLRNETVNFYPLAIGNRWVYLTVSVVNPYITYGVALNEVIGDSIAANGKMYYHLKENNYHSLERIDTVEGKVYRYYENPNLPQSEYVVANLTGEVGDTLITFNPSGPSPAYLIVTSIDTFYKWGLTKLRKNFIRYAYPSFSRFSYTQDIGMDYWVSTLIGYSMYSERTLKGCLLNGILYGDTTLTGIDDEESPIASEFKLEQNYPNPFNPSTVISYRLPETSNVTLKIYDILGNEIATLVNEEKPAGEYEVEFNAASHSGNVRNLTSGIYFYQIRAGDPSTGSGQSFVQTKKMILLK